MRLASLINGIAINNFQGDRDLEIEGLACDSRKVRPGYLFVALKGHTEDGHHFLREAVKNGAVALVTHEAEGVKEDVTVIQVPDSRAALSELSATFYGRPFEGMNLIGITGTNGKTTTSYLLEAVLLRAGARAGVIGTINYRYPGYTCGAPVTTPESLDLMKALRKMADAGVTDVVMEVSSHALDQGRTRSCPFRAAVFTNISRDHLDYHNSMEAYFEAKTRLFKGLAQRASGETTAVINMDDPRGGDLAKITDAPVLAYGLGEGNAVRAEDIQASTSGLTATLVTPSGKRRIHSRLVGDFNVYNILAATGAALCLGIDVETVGKGLEGLETVPGRLERVKNRRSLPIFVDYAHTPDAFQKALGAVRPLAQERVITVFGCGGDRDQGKRAEMGRVAGEHSDLVIITSDNPRTEDPLTIALQIEEGVRHSELEKINDSSRSPGPHRGYMVELDRGEAIRMATRMAQPGDLILIAGKGHEDYQIVGKERRAFDDRKAALEAALREV